VNLRVNSGPHGLRVAIEEVHPVFDKTVSEGKWVTDTQTLLEAHLPRIVDIKEVVQELKQVFEGPWQYSFAASKSYSLVGPTFTQNGDLIMQLGAFAEGSTTKTITSSAASPSRPGRESTLLSLILLLTTPSHLVLNKFKSMAGYALEAPPLRTSTSFQDEEITDDFSMPALNVEQPKLAPRIFKTSAPETDTAEPEITLAGF
jgi:hypothetical protein